MFNTLTFCDFYWPSQQSKKIYGFFIGLLFFVHCCLAQNYQFSVYGPEEGLSQEYVNTIIKDQRGLLWIGTQDGLNRFDGYEFKVFRKDKRNPKSLAGNFINTLAEDQLGNIWIGTKNNGLNYYHPRSGQFRRMELEGLQKNAQCNQLSVDGQGSVYAAFLQEGVVRLRPQQDTILSESIPFFDSLRGNITCLKALPPYLLAGTREGQVYYADLRSEGLTFNSLNHDFGGYKIHAFALFQDQVLIGTDEGLLKWNPDRDQVIRLNRETINNTYVYEIATNQEEIFLATDSGLFHAQDFDGSDAFSTLQHYYQDGQNGLTSNLITHLLLEKDELWFGGNRLYYTALKEPVFKKLPYQAIYQSVVYTLVKDGPNTWIGTEKGLFLATENQLYHYTKTHGLPHAKIRNIAIDTKRNLWVGTQKGVVTIALDAFAPEAPQLQLIPAHEEESLSLGLPKVRDIYVDEDGHIWIATLGKGLFRFRGDLKAGDYRFQQFKNKPDDPNSLNTNVAYAFYRDRQNTYWIGTEKGVNSLRFENQDFNRPNFSTFLNEEGDSTSLSNNTVLSFLEDRQGNLWIGTLNGLNKYQPSSKRFKIYDEDQGLTNGVIYAILEDVEGQLWVSTNTGLFRFNPQTERFSHYGTKDGLQNKEYTLGATFIDADKQLYFGGANGYNFFHPRDIDNLDGEGKLLFTDLRVNEENRQIPTTIELAYDQFPVYLKFSDLNYEPRKNSQYIYQLAPKDQYWNELQSRREIQLLSLAPGTYELRLQGKTRGELWQAPPLTMDIVVHPPWWRTTWMYGVYLLGLMGIIYLIYRFLLARQLQREETKKLQEINQLKTQLYTNITHEFRTPITVIKGLTNHLKEQLRAKQLTETENTLDTIQHNSNQVLNLVNQMLDLAKVDKRKFTLHYTQSDIVWFVERIVAQFSSYASSKGIALTFYSEEKNGMMDFDRDALQKVISNLLSNAIKNSAKGDSIIVHTRVDTQPQPQLLIRVKDTGKGIAPADLPHIFDQFYQGPNNGQVSEGTGIGLTLTRELVQLMKGRIEVESEEQQGSTFIVTLPISNEAAIENEKEAIIDAFALRPSSVLENGAAVSPPNDPETVVLVVDDNEDIISLLQLSLQEHYQVLTAKNGKEGVSQALTHIPDIIISDVMMPDTNGYELCAQLKANDKTSHIPIILLTAKATDHDRLLGLSQGADAFITKPFQKAELFIRIEELIKLRALLYQKYATASAWDAVERSDLQDKDAAFINSVLYHIEQQMDDPQLNAARLAKKLALSESQLYRKLKALTDSSTANFIRKVRLQKAKALLQSTDNTVSEVAYQTGFSSPSWFSRAFKQEFGYAPNELRK